MTKFILWLVFVSIVGTLQAEDHRGHNYGYRGSSARIDVRPYPYYRGYYYNSLPWAGGYYGNYANSYMDYRYPSVVLGFSHNNDGCRKVTSKDVNGNKIKGLVCTEANGDHKYFPVQ